MKTTILAKILTAFLFLSLSAFYPCLSFALEIAPKVINFGDIPRNKVIRQEIQIKNNEYQPVILEKARASCGCITLEYEKNKQLEENDFYKIILILNTAELSEGKLKKFIFLSLKDSKQPIYSIEVKGNIKNSHN